MTFVHQQAAMLEEQLKTNEEQSKTIKELSITNEQQSITLHEQSLKNEQLSVTVDKQSASIQVGIVNKFEVPLIRILIKYLEQ